METVRDQWEKITDMTGAEHLDRIGDATMSLMTSLESLRTDRSQETKSDNFSPFSYTDKDLILYALGGLYNVCIKLFSHETPQHLYCKCSNI